MSVTQSPIAAPRAAWIFPGNAIRHFAMIFAWSTIILETAVDRSFP
jgi:hypothetical protein